MPRKRTTVISTISEDTKIEASITVFHVVMLGAYVVLTKTELLLAVLLAVSAWKTIEIIGIVVCMIHTVCSFSCAI